MPSSLSLLALLPCLVYDADCPPASSATQSQRGMFVLAGRCHVYFRPLSSNVTLRIRPHHKFKNNPNHIDI